MEEVMLMEGLMEEERMNPLFPKLEVLWLEDLPKLSRFCYENYFEFRCLRILRVTECPLLETFISKYVNAGDEPHIDQNAQRYELEVDSTAFFNEKVISSFLLFFAYHSFLINSPFFCYAFFHEEFNLPI